MEKGRENMTFSKGKRTRQESLHNVISNDYVKSSEINRCKVELLSFKYFKLVYQSRYGQETDGACELAG